MRANSSTSSSRRLLPASIAALISCIAVLVLLNIALAMAAPYFDSNYNNMRDINDRAWIDGADVLFLGDSRTHQALIPSVFSRSATSHGWNVDAINLGRPGMQLPFAYFIADRVINQAKQPPKAIVINISFYLLGGDQWMKDIYLAYYRPSLSEFLTAALRPFNGAARNPEWFVRTRIPAWTFRARVDTLVQNMIANPQAAFTELAGLNRMREIGSFDVAQGYLSRGDEHISPEDVEPSRYSTGFERGYSAYLRYLDMLIETATQAGVEVYVYRFPWPEQRAEEPQFLAVVEYYWQMLKEHQADNIIFLDELRFWPVDYFVDPLHLNHAGSTRLSHELGEEIADLRQSSR